MSAGATSSAGGAPPITRPTFRALAALALPMVLARATQAMITFADTYQIKGHGADALAAVATGGMNVFLIVILPMGTAFILQSFVAQRVGRGERDETIRYAWYGLALAAAAAVLAVLMLPAVRPVIGLLGFEPEVKAQMGDYMLIRLLSVGAIAGTEAMGAWYGGLGNTWMHMLAGILAMVVNIVLNAVLIPRYGVEGAAIASTIASWLGFVFIVLAFAGARGGAPRRARRASRGLSWVEFGRVLRFGLPNGLNWLLEFAAFQVFLNVVLGDLGTEAVATFNIVFAINMLSFMPAFGMSSAGAILAGQLIGQGARDLVWPQVKLTLAATAGWMGTIALLYVTIPGLLIGLFVQAGPEGARMIELGTSMLLLSGAWQLFDAVAMTLSETLRAAGDTTWSAGARLILAWAVFMPSAWLVVHVGGAGVLAAMACLAGYVALLAGVLAWRFASGAWRRIELIEPELV